MRGRTFSLARRAILRRRSSKETKTRAPSVSAAATSAAESSVQTWRQVHLGGIILNVSLAVVLIGLLFTLRPLRAG